ncbi:MAG: fumarylacetoacetate hydrolase family protein, partial [Chloroflexi bacterium]|nr:fumarylacetoacetate hydrolase family protein [Chloroflexota bacterium]
MKLVLFEPQSGGDVLPGALTDAGVVSLSAVAPRRDTPQETMEAIIDGFEELQPRFEAAIAAGPALSLAAVRLRAPLPRPSKVINCIANYWEHAQREPRPLNMFLKNPDAVIGPGDTLELPDFTVPWMFMHEAELAVVIKGPANGVRRENWRSAVFGYTGFIDGTGRGDGRSTWGRGTWLGKSFDTFCPIGPCIA